MMKNKAFTLIELLIVVAIIAILAAIAVPNFLEAQVRAKVSRVKADQRTLATAVETYFIDNNRYPPDHQFAATSKKQNSGVIPSSWDVATLAMLSTPIAYVTSTNMPDPFFSGASNKTGMGNPGAPGEIVLSYRYMNMGYGIPDVGYCWGDTMAQGIPALATEGILPTAGWGLKSYGPDRVDSGGEWYVFGDIGETASQTPAPDRLYDPTNGTISAGDLMRFGGSVGSGPAN
jgi:general secretion pathway protein G